MYHLLLLCGSRCIRCIGEDTVFTYFDGDILGDSDDEGRLLHLFDLTVDTACGNDLVALLHALALLLNLFLTLGLRTNHKEIEDDEDGDHHDPKTPLTLLLTFSSHFCL